MSTKTRPIAADWQTGSDEVHVELSDELYKVTKDAYRSRKKSGGKVYMSVTASSRGGRRHQRWRRRRSRRGVRGAVVLHKP